MYKRELYVLTGMNNIVKQGFLKFYSILEEGDSEFTTYSWEIFIVKKQPACFEKQLIR